jgi:hypothetical protein
MGPSSSFSLSLEKRPFFASSAHDSISASVALRFTLFFSSPDIFSSSDII